MRFSNSPKSGGIAPLSAFWWSSRSPRFLRCPNSGGIAPLSAFWWRYRCVRFLRFPNSAGREPLSSLPAEDQLSDLAVRIRCDPVPLTQIRVVAFSQLSYWSVQFGPSVA